MSSIIQRLAMACVLALLTVSVVGPAATADPSTRAGDPSALAGDPATLAGDEPRIALYAKVLHPPCPGGNQGDIATVPYLIMVYGTRWDGNGDLRVDGRTYGATLYKHNTGVAGFCAAGVWLRTTSWTWSTCATCWNLYVEQADILA